MVKKKDKYDIICFFHLHILFPVQISEWFTADFLNHHRIYAIKEEEPFLLRVFTRNHESTNRGIRKKGGRKVSLEIKHMSSVEYVIH